MKSDIRVLIVEDDPFLAIDLEDTLEAAGYKVSAVATTVSQGLSAIEREAPEIATLDYNLGHETSDAIADELRQRHIPFCYITGHMGRLGGENVPVIDKPVASRMVLRTLRDLSRKVN